MSSASKVHLQRKTKTSVGYLTLMVLLVAIIEPLMTLPQIIQIFSTKNAAGVSLLTWAAYLLAALVWLAYGAKIKDKPLAITGVLWAIMDAMVIVGVVHWR